ncbi:MAG: Phosphate acyltransferase [Candidatus Celerinatantimonas neptuna]|nr:MAG: Phosphate acyltransferase [Candidatus Celerinatantimonas neptuna]
MATIVAKKLLTSKAASLQHLTLALDAMGGDYGPSVIVPAVQQAISHYPYIHFFLVGDRAQIGSELACHQLTQSHRISILHTQEIISDEDKPSNALKAGRHSSMRLALEQVAIGQAQACISAGNTGALMALARSVLKPLPGITRPALISIFPTHKNTQTVMLDLGANINSGDQLLFQFAMMGSILVCQLWGIDTPKVALLNIGRESIKGSESIKKTAVRLKQCDFVDFRGNIEGNRIFNGDVDVIVCDGFVGNVALKTAEGTAEYVLKIIKQQLSSNMLKRLCMRFLMPELATQITQLSPQRYNGACLLGLDGIVVKSHGGANQSAFFRAIQEAVELYQHQIPRMIGEQLQEWMPKKTS